MAAQMSGMPHTILDDFAKAPVSGQTVASAAEITLTVRANEVLGGTARAIAGLDEPGDIDFRQLIVTGGRKLEQSIARADEQRRFKPIDFRPTNELRARLQSTSRQRFHRRLQPVACGLRQRVIGDRFGLPSWLIFEQQPDVHLIRRAEHRLLRGGAQIGAIGAIVHKIPELHTPGNKACILNCIRVH